VSAPLDASASSLAWLSALQALAALALLLAVAWYARRALLRGSLLGRRNGQLQLEERLGIDLRNALVIVRIADRRLLLATSDHGPARLIAELAAESATPSLDTLKRTGIERLDSTPTNASAARE